MENIVKIVGKLYSHDLEFKQDDSGRNLVRGSFGILVDEKTKQTEKIEVYIYEKTKKDTINKTYSLLNKIVQNQNNFYETNKSTALQVRAQCSMTLNPYYVKEGDNFELREPRRNRLVFLNEDAITPMGAAFSLDCDISAITERVDENGMPTNEADLTVKYYDEYAGTMSFKLRVDNPDYLAIIQTNFIQGQPNLMKLGGKIVDLTIEKEVAQETAFGVNTVSTSSRNVKTYLVDSGQFLVADENFEELKTKCDQKRQEKLAEAKDKAVKKEQEQGKAKTTNVGFGTAQMSGLGSDFKF